MSTCHVCHDTKFVDLFTGRMPCTDCPRETALANPDAPVPVTSCSMRRRGPVLSRMPSVSEHQPPVVDTVTPHGAGCDERLALISCTATVVAGATSSLRPWITSEYFEPKYARLVVADPVVPAVQRSVWISMIGICGCAQEDAFNNYTGSTRGLPSEAYDQWMRVPWAPFGSAVIGRDLYMDIANRNTTTVQVTLLVRGRPTNVAPADIGVPRRIA